LDAAYNVVLNVIKAHECSYAANRSLKNYRMDLQRQETEGGPVSSVEIER